LEELKFLFLGCQAHEICVRKGFLKEQAFILGRMGNSKQALAVIINQLGDMEEVIALKANVAAFFFILSNTIPLHSACLANKPLN